MHFGYPIHRLRTWAETTFPGPQYQAVFKKLPLRHENKHIKNAIHAWRRQLTQEERVLLEEILARWESIGIAHPGFVQNYIPSKKAALATGYYHPEGKPSADVHVQQLMAEGEAILEAEEQQKRKEEKKKHDADTLRKIIKYASKYSEEEVAVELASNCIWKRVALLKSSNLPKSLTDKLTEILEKRKTAIQLKDAARKIGADPSDLQRWADAGKIKTLGYRLVAHGMITFMDRDSLPTREQIEKLAADEAHLPESERVLGYWAQCTLIKRGWKKSEIVKHLGEPDAEADNPHWKSGPPMRLFLKARVLRAEEAGLAPAKPKDNVR